MHRLQIDLWWLRNEWRGCVVLHRCVARNDFYYGLDGTGKGVGSGDLFCRTVKSVGPYNVDGRMTGEWRVGKHLEWKWLWVNRGKITLFFWRGWGKLRNPGNTMCAGGDSNGQPPECSVESYCCSDLLDVEGTDTPSSNIRLVWSLWFTVQLTCISSHQVRKHLLIPYPLLSVHVYGISCSFIGHFPWAWHELISPKQANQPWREHRYSERNISHICSFPHEGNSVQKYRLCHFLVTVQEYLRSNSNFLF